MGQLTNDMTRLADEIQMSRDGRGRLLRDLNQATVEMKVATAGMRAGFRSTRVDMVRSQQQMLRGFVSGLKATVAGLRTELMNDLAGARKAWAGATGGPMQGRARRSTKYKAVP